MQVQLNEQKLVVDEQLKPQAEMSPEIQDLAKINIKNMPGRKNSKEVLLEFSNQNQLFLNLEQLPEVDGPETTASKTESEDGYLPIPKQVEVFVSSCFPWSAPNQFISLRNSENLELHLVHQMDDLDVNSATALQQALDLLQFTYQIDEVFSMEESFAVRFWKVKTQKGVRRFQTLLDTWPIRISENVMLIKDIYNDHYILDLNKGYSKGTLKNLQVILD